MSAREIMSGRERAEVGCIVSFEGDGGELTLHRLGPQRAALRAACADALALDPTARVVAYSTPQTIYADLGGRMTYDVSNQAGGTGKSADTPRPEVLALGGIGMGWMAHPRLGYGHAGTQTVTRSGTRKSGA